ncbi:hypothetical protein M5E87_15530 [Flavonifractor plautii]|nr:hypothetical protein M5E87_15530 [Flavonifractor plautii]
MAKSKQLAEITKLSLNNASEEDAIKKAYVEIGKLYYAERGMAPEAAYVALCERITAAKVNIEENKNRIAELKAEGNVSDADIPTWRPTCPLRSRWTAAAAAAITRWLPRRYSPTTTSPRNRHLTRQGPPSGGPCSCEWTALTLMRCTAIDGADAAQGGERGAGRWEGKRGLPAAPARRETELGFLQKGQIHLKIPPKTASDTKT